LSIKVLKYLIPIGLAGALTMLEIEIETSNLPAECRIFGVLIVYSINLYMI